MSNTKNNDPHMESKNNSTNPVPKDSDNKNLWQKFTGGIHGWVFWPSALIILIFILGGLIFPKEMGEVLAGVQTGISDGFGWFYVLVVSACVVFALYMGFSKYGKIKLAKNDDEEPEFSFLSWLSMLFAAGMGIGLVFFGVAEPLSHFVDPPPGSPGDILPGNDSVRAQGAMDQTLLHWGIHPWAVYVVVGLALAYTIHRRNRPVSLRYALEPLLGKHVRGGWGNVIDVIAVVGTLFGVTTSLGLGVIQISSGLQQSNIVPKDIDGQNLLMVQIVLIIAITIITIFSLVSGVGRGMKWLSNINLGLAALLLIFVIAFGPTLFIMREFVESTGSYLQNIIGMSFNTRAFEKSGENWEAGNTIFYWGWWISWSAFVGIFIARISKGRTVREFVFAALIVPTILTVLWFSAMGGSALYREIFQGGGLVGADGVDSNAALFLLLEGLPGGAIAIIGAILLIVLFFITSSDSGSLVLSMLSTGGETEPKNWIRIFWAITTGLVAAALLLSGGLSALQTVSIIGGLPFAVVIIGIMISTIIVFRREIKDRKKSEQAKEREEISEYINDQVSDHFSGDLGNQLAEQVTDQLVVLDGPFRKEAFKEEALGKSIERQVAKQRAKRQAKREK